jgi:hypothetical protein
MEVLVFEHFNAIFGQAAVRRSSINFEVLGILPVDLHQLDLAITPEEVWAAIRDMPSDKALGLDGFTGAFFKSAWQIINDDFMEAINAFIEGSGQRLHLINNALVVHLPEEGHLTPGILQANNIGSQFRQDRIQNPLPSPDTSPGATDRQKSKCVHQTKIHP